MELLWKFHKFHKFLSYARSRVDFLPVIDELLITVDFPLIYHGGLFFAKLWTAE
jgi:hypothetical protein